MKSLNTWGRFVRHERACLARSPGRPFDRCARMDRAAQYVLNDILDPGLVDQALSLAEYAPNHLHKIDEGKANLWLGFVQGIVITGGLTTVQAERDYTRPLFHALHGPSRSHESRK